MRIALTQGQFAIVDDDDFEELNRFRWSAHWNPQTRSFYAIRNVPLQRGGYTGMAMARQIVRASKGVLVDHRDHDTLNNRRLNLRVATSSQNACNRVIQNRNSSGFKGVHWRAKVQKWQARITVNGTTYSLGHFRTAEAAGAAYAAGAIAKHGEFAHDGRKVLHPCQFVSLNKERVDIEVKA